MDDEKIKKIIDLNFNCIDCQNNEAICHICKKKGKYYGPEGKLKKEK